MANYNWLRRVVQESRFDGQTDAQVAATLTTADKDGDLSTRDILNYLSVAPTPAGTSTISLALRVAGKTGEAEVQAMVEEIFAQLERNGDISLDVPAYKAAFEATCDRLIASGLMDADDKVALLAMGLKSEAALNGFANLEAADVGEARGV